VAEGSALINGGDFALSSGGDKATWKGRQWTLVESNVPASGVVAVLGMDARSRL